MDFRYTWVEMTKTNIIYPFFFLILFTINGCGNFEDIEIGDINRVQFKGFVNNAVTFEAIVPISNPTNTRFRVKEIDLRTTINGNYLGRVICDEVVIIPSKSDIEHRFVLRMHVANILQSAAFFMKSSHGNRYHIEIEGHVKVRSLLITKVIPVKESTIIDGF